jgi:hypothetical protein
MAFQAHQLLSEDKAADAFHSSLLMKAKNYGIPTRMAKVIAFLVQLISTASCKGRRGKMMNPTCKSIKVFNSEAMLDYGLRSRAT